MIDPDADERSLATDQATARRYGGGWFAAVVAPAFGILIIVALAFAHVIVLAGAVVGIAAAAIVTVIRSRVRGMTVDRAYGLALVAMLVTNGIIIAAIIVMLVAYGLVMNDF